MATRLVLFTLLFVTSSSTHTGISSCIIEIIPVGYGDNGIVLFKTSFTMNAIGAYIPFIPRQLGWLVVSAQGVWQEKKHHYLDFNGGNEMSSTDSAYIREFNARFNWKNPPQTVRSLIAKYHIKEIKANEGKNSISWTKHGIYKDGKRVDSAFRIRSLEDVYSAHRQGTPMHVSFYHQGIALFRSLQQINEDGEQEEVKGAVFLQGTKLKGYGAVWIEYYMIDGLMIVKENQ